MPVVMRLPAAYRARVLRRTDSEHDQALVRIVVLAALLVVTASIAAGDASAAGRLWAIAAFSTAFSVLLLALILRDPAPSPARRVVGAVHDNLAATLWLCTAGPSGALALFVYPFVTVGNGFRYGVRYLAVSGLLGAGGIGVLVFAGPGWGSYGTMGVGVLLSHVVVTVYTGLLLGRLQATKARLAELATRDPLTGLPNRRFFLERLAERVHAPRRAPLACLYLDLDGFKAVNDRWGHDVGDELLNRVAAAVRGCVREGDTVARLGGDEFTLVVEVPSGEAGARLFAERIVAAIAAIGEVDGHAVDVSVSIGIALLPAGASAARFDGEDVLRAADAAMYVAKRSGAGRYSFAAPVALAAAS
jgi:diguanylate cyclase (GGDEF)-like protein